MTKPKVDHTDTKCCICESHDTHIKLDGNSFWTRHKDSKGIWDNKSYECYKCHYNIGKSIEPVTPKNYFEGRRCSICGNDKSYQNHWYKRYSEKGTWDKKSYMCLRCYGRYDPDSGHNQIKIIANSRNCQLDIRSPSGKGLIGEATIAKVRKLDVISIMLDHFGSKFDLSLDPEFGNIQSKLRNSRYGNYDVYFGMLHDFDTLFVICINEDTDNIESICVIPEDELYGITNITIYNNPKYGSKWDKYTLNKDNIKPYNDTYVSLMELLKDRKYFGIEDIKKWLDTKEKS